jgi:hypothetical protein
VFAYEVNGASGLLKVFFIVSYIVRLVASPPPLWLIKLAVCRRPLPSRFLSFAYIAPWGSHTSHPGVRIHRTLGFAYIAPWGSHTSHLSLKWSTLSSINRG